MSRFASHLESIGQSKHALLAWERVIDTTYPDKNERKQALSAIKRLKGSQPPWNPDPSSGIQLTLQAGASVNDAQALKRALEIAAQNMSTASGGVVQVSVKLSLGKKPKQSSRCCAYRTMAITAGLGNRHDSGGDISRFIYG